MKLVRYSSREWPSINNPVVSRANMGILVFGASTTLGKEFCLLALANKYRIKCFVPEDADLSFLDKCPRSLYEIIRIDYDRLWSSFHSSLFYCANAAVSFLVPTIMCSNETGLSIDQINKYNTTFADNCFLNHINPFVFCSSTRPVIFKTDRSYKRIKVEEKLAKIQFDNLLILQPGKIDIKSNRPDSIINKYTTSMVKKIVAPQLSNTPLSIAVAALSYLVNPGTESIKVFNTSCINKIYTKHSMKL